MQRVWDWVRTKGSGIAASAGLLAICLGVLPGAARGLDEPAPRTVRLAYAQGDVTILRADNTGGDPAQLNMPLTEGMRVATGASGEAEVEFEDGSVLRLTPQSQVALQRLRTGTDHDFDTQITVVNGLVYAELRATPRYAYRIDAGGDTVTPVANASIRILLDQPPPSVSVLDGTAHVASAGYQVDVGKGESLRGDPEGGSRYFLTQGVEHNTWDDWNEARDQAAANDSVVRTEARDGYAGDQGYGWSDLDADGTWFDAGQGPVWQPYDASSSGFDPYGYGSWVYTSYSGYVWSSGYRWGWTPFRCGSWNYWQDFGWGWSPAGNCGGYAGGGGIRRHEGAINISHVPPGYKRPLPPVSGGPVRVHPIVPVRTGPAPTRNRREASEARQIAGRTAMPLRTLGGGYTPRGGSAVGSSLRRDFPVDRVTRQPVLGALTAPPGRRGTEDSARPRGQVPGAAGATGGRPQDAGTTGAAGTLFNYEGGRQGRGSAGTGDAGRRASPGGNNESGGDRSRFPGERGGSLAGRSQSTPTPAAATSGVPSGSVPASPAGGAAQLPPPPQGVRVHPGERAGDHGGEPVRERQAGPVGEVSRPNRVQPAPEMRRALPSERSTPSPPPPQVRSTPAPPPATVRSAPAASAPATPAAANQKK